MIQQRKMKPARKEGRDICEKKFLAMQNVEKHVHIVQKNAITRFRTRKHQRIVQYLIGSARTCRETNSEAPRKGNTHRGATCINTTRLCILGLLTSPCTYNLTTNNVARNLKALRQRNKHRAVIQMNTITQNFIRHWQRAPWRRRRGRWAGLARSRASWRRCHHRAVKECRCERSMRLCDPRNVNTRRLSAGNYTSCGT